MNDVRRVMTFCVAVVLGGLVARAIQIVIVILSRDLTDPARAMAVCLGMGFAAMFGAAAATLASNRKGARASCVIAGVPLAGLAFDKSVAIAPPMWAAIVVLVGLGAWLGHVRFRR